MATKKNPKDEIITYISKYMKATKDPKEYQETIQNLKDFLQYLEDKHIINCKQLESNKDEMHNLIKDLMKLDLNKFCAPKSATCKNSPNITASQPGLRRNSADQVIDSDVGDKKMTISPSGEMKMPANSPGNIVCYYSPINVNGNGNVINTNFQICPNNEHLKNKPFNCSQKLFSHDKDEDEVPTIVIQA